MLQQSNQTTSLPWDTMQREDLFQELVYHVCTNNPAQSHWIADKSPVLLLGISILVQSGVI